MALLSKAQILAAGDIEYDTVDVPEWNGEVRVKTWSVAEADAVVGLIQVGQSAGLIPLWREKIVAFSVVDAVGATMFDEDDIAALGRKSTAAMNRVFKAAMTLNKLGNYADPGNEEAAEAESPNA